MRVKPSTRHDEQIDERFHQLNLDNIANVVYWHEFFKIIKTVVGDIVECGVGRGRSLIILMALNALQPKQERRRIFAYDSFCGFPKPTEEDRSPRNPKAGEWAVSPSGKYRYTPEFLQQVAASAGLDSDFLERAGFVMTLRPGFFRDTLPTHPRRPIALLNIDGDLYQSYKDCLENLYPMVSPGAVIAFDDFGFAEDHAESFPGARRAVREFLGAAYSDLRCSPRGNPYYIKPA